jgi:hypothetical protein
MAKKQAREKDSIYFEHDYNARNDMRILRLRERFGWEGYGLWWAFLEVMREQANAMVKYSDCNTIAMQLQCIRNANAMPTQCERIKLTDLVDFCLEEGLLVRENGFIFSKRMQRDFLHMKERSENASKSANKRWSKDANAMRSHSERNAKEDSIVEYSIPHPGKDVGILRTSLPSQNGHGTTPASPAASSGPVPKKNKTVGMKYDEHNELVYRMINGLKMVYTSDAEGDEARDALWIITAACLKKYKLRRVLEQFRAQTESETGHEWRWYEAKLREIAVANGVNPAEWEGIAYDT